MENAKVTIVDCGGTTETKLENCSPADVVLLMMNSLRSLVEHGVIPRPFVRAGLDALRFSLYSDCDT